MRNLRGAEARPPEGPEPGALCDMPGMAWSHPPRFDVVPVPRINTNGRGAILSIPFSPITSGPPAFPIHPLIHDDEGIDYLRELSLAPEDWLELAAAEA